MTSAAAAALEVVGAVKDYGEVRALDEVSWSLDGGVHGLLGANGAGKTTLLRAIVDLVRLDAGSIAVGGVDSVRDGVASRRQIGYLPEEPSLYERLTGREYLAFVAGLRGLDNAGERGRLLELFELGDRADLLLAECSLGMRKKVALASALMGTPRLVLLDEPLNGLDTENMRRLRLEIETMAAAGTTFVLSSHVMSFVERICDDALILRAGRVVSRGTMAEIRAQAGMPDAPFEDVFLSLAAGT